MKKVIVIYLICASMASYAQTVKKQIGTSIWIKNNEIFADSSLSSITQYDQQGKEITIWKIFRDTAGVINDTNYIVLDSMGNTIRLVTANEEWLLEYDKFGSQTKIIIFKNNDTTIIKYRNAYDKKNRLIATHSSINGEEFKLEKNYKYKRRTTKMSQLGICFQTTKRNKINKIIFQETITDYRKNPEYKDFPDLPSKISESISWKYDKKGQVLLYNKIKNGILIKRTDHYYKNDFEIKQVEKFYNPNYEVITVFKYEYW